MVIIIILGQSPSPSPSPGGAELLKALQGGGGGGGGVHFRGVCPAPLVSKSSPWTSAAPDVLPGDYPRPSKQLLWLQTTPTRVC